MYTGYKLRAFAFFCRKHEETSEFDGYASLGLDLTMREDITETRNKFRKFRRSFGRNISITKSRHEEASELKFVEKSVG